MSVHPGRRCRRVGAAVLLLGVLAAPAHAQTARWEIDGYGGIVLGGSGSDTATLPPTGGAIVTSSPVFSSRAVPSWMFGDGATLLNNVNIQFGAAGRITPLDALFTPRPSARGAAFGVRLRRTLNSRWAAEFSVDMLPAAAPPEGLEAAVEATRASFKTAFGNLIATGPFSGVTIDATASTSGGRRRDIAATGAAAWSFGRWGSFTPYATFGGGVISGLGTGPSASISGEYRFSILGQAAIAETDRVSVRYTSATTPVGVAGGGVRREMSDRWGLRIDARVLIGRDPTRVLLDAAPTTATASPAGFIESFTSPAIQFSNNASTGRASTLSGAALDGFEVFAGNSRRYRTLVTVAVTRHF